MHKFYKRNDDEMMFWVKKEYKHEYKVRGRGTIMLFWVKREYEAEADEIIETSNGVRELIVNMVNFAKEGKAITLEQLGIVNKNSVSAMLAIDELQKRVDKGELVLYSMDIEDKMKRDYRGGVLV